MQKSVDKRIFRLTQDLLSQVHGNRNEIGLVKCTILFIYF
jgi:hypothetical protein